MNCDVAEAAVSTYFILIILWLFVCFVVCLLQGDEYVVYSTNQQRMMYLVEFCLHGDHSDEIPLVESYVLNPVAIDDSVGEDEGGNEVTPVNLNDVKDVADPLAKVKAGLQGGGADVPLTAVHIKARLLDLAAQVREGGRGGVRGRGYKASLLRWQWDLRYFASCPCCQGDCVPSLQEQQLGAH